MKKLLLLVLLLVLGIGLTAQTRIKDIAVFAGQEPRQLLGYGLVIGLAGTGDGSSSQITVQAIKNMMDRFGVSVSTGSIKPNNVASVLVTATVPAFTRSGSTLDCTVSSVGDAKSIEGGTLFLTSLCDTDGNEWAVAQGPVTIGGLNSDTGRGRGQKNYNLVGRVVGGALLSRDNIPEIFSNGEICLALNNPDFSTARLMEEKINSNFGIKLATALDAGRVSVLVPDSIMAARHLTTFMSKVENLGVIPQQRARVVINERTGTIVAGGDVYISPVAISHGSLTIEIGAKGNEPAREEKVLAMQAATVAELAESLNRIRVIPRDLIAIFQTLKAAGALQAEIVVM